MKHGYFLNPTCGMGIIISDDRHAALAISKTDMQDPGPTNSGESEKEIKAA